MKKKSVLLKMFAIDTTRQPLLIIYINSDEILLSGVEIDRKIRKG